ncbi:hypothetical protein CES87_05310 [Pseudomonas sp. ERMR1:02]|nr:hypothetical protein CES87_05310 [Pseudomonas sp. ERMR1:02]
MPIKVIISHRLGLEQAAEGYKIFNKKEEDCRKVILTPGDHKIAIPNNTPPVNAAAHTDDSAPDTLFHG